MPPEHICATCGQHGKPPCEPAGQPLCGPPDHHKWRPKECPPTCPLEGRVVELEAIVHADCVIFKQHRDELDALEARLHALELAIIADVAEIEKLKTLAEQGTDLFEEHDERLQALERPAAPAQRQPGNTCSTCRFQSVLMADEPCRSCWRSHWQPRQGAGL